MYKKKAKHTKDKKYTNNKKWRNLLVLLLVVFVVIPISFSKYTEKLSETLTLNIRKPNYTVNFYSNRDDGNEDEIKSQQFVYGTIQNLEKNTYTKEGYYFVEWNTETDGKGTPYTDEEEVYNLSSVDVAEINLYAQWKYAVAEIDGTYYDTLQDAIDAVPTNNTETTVKLLNNTSENVKVNVNQNIVFDLQNFTIRNNGDSAVITNKGTIKITNGTITSSAFNAAINNEQGGILTMSGGKIIATGTKQAIYNNNGIVEITGNAYLSATTEIRATVQNLELGKLTITGGTIISINQQAVNNAGTMTIGTKDGNIDTNLPLLQGVTYGVTSSSNFNFYDGIIKGKTGAIDNEANVIDKETGYDVVHETQVIEGVTYEAAYLSTGNTVTFNPNEGTLILGIKNDGDISTTAPLITGDGYGVSSVGVFKFYDGIIKGVTDAISGTITEYEPSTEIKNDTEVINGKTYKTVYLEFMQ